MIRWLGVMLLLGGSAAGQFVEIQVDAAASEGRIRPTFGIDAPEDERQARLLSESGAGLRVRLGSGAALPELLAERLEGAWADDTERPVYDGRSIQKREPMTWRFAPSGPEAEAAEALALAMRLQQGPATQAYYSRGSSAWFDEDGRPYPVTSGLALAGRMEDAPHRVRLEVGPGGAIQGLAGVSEDGETVQILLSRTESKEDAGDELPGYVVYVRNLPWGARSFRTERYRVDAESAGELVTEDSGRGGLARISAQLEPLAVELIVLRRQDEPDGSGVLHRRGRAAPSSSPR